MDLSDFEIAESNNDDFRFGVIDILYNRNNPSETIFIKRKVSSSPQEYSLAIANTTFRKSLQSPYLLRMIDFFHKEEEMQIDAIFEYTPDDISALYEQMRSIPEIFRFLEHILEALSFLENHKMVHGNLRPEFVYFKASDNVYVVQDRLGESLSPMESQLKMFNSNESLYVPPNIFRELFNQNPSYAHKPFKVETFALGMIVLTLYLGEERVQTVYDRQTGDFDQLRFESLLKYVAKNFFSENDESELIWSFIETALLEVDSSSRPSPKNALAALKEIKREVAIRGKLDLSVTSSLINTAKTSNILHEKRPTNSSNSQALVAEQESDENKDKIENQPDSPEPQIVESLDPSQFELNQAGDQIQQDQEYHSAIQFEVDSSPKLEADDDDKSQEGKEDTKESQVEKSIPPNDENQNELEKNGDNEVFEEQRKSVRESESQPNHGDQDVDHQVNEETVNRQEEISVSPHERLSEPHPLSTQDITENNVLSDEFRHKTVEEVPILAEINHNYGDQAFKDEEKELINNDIPQKNSHTKNTLSDLETRQKESIISDALSSRLDSKAQHAQFTQANEPSHQKIDGIFIQQNYNSIPITSVSNYASNFSALNNFASTTNRIQDRSVSPIFKGTVTAQRIVSKSPNIPSVQFIDKFPRQIPKKPQEPSTQVYINDQYHLLQQQSSFPLTRPEKSPNPVYAYVPSDFQSVPLEFRNPPVNSIPQKIVYGNQVQVSRSKSPIVYQNYGSNWLHKDKDYQSHPVNQINLPGQGAPHQNPSETPSRPLLYKNDALGFQREFQNSNMRFVNVSQPHVQGNYQSNVVKIDDKSQINDKGTVLKIDNKNLVLVKVENGQNIYRYEEDVNK